MRLITYDGRTQNLRDWSQEIGISWRALQNRLAKGWPLEQALSAGKGELYKGKPALAPLARKAGVPARLALHRKAAGHPMEKVLQPGVLSRPLHHPLTFNGQTKSITEWANELGISQSALSNRLSRGWPLERALSWRRKPKEGPIGANS
jgi:lambda repressor-like predicted transcriptional regulator